MKKMENETKQKLRKILVIACAAVGIASLVMFIPAVRNFIIDLGERYVGRPLTREVWHGQLIKWESLFLISLLVLELIIAIHARKNNLKAFMASFDNQVHIVSFFVFTIFLLAVHSFINPVSNDDVYFSSALNGTNLLEFLKNRYHTWSSRTLIEMVLVNIYIGQGGLWRVMNVLCYAVIAECIISLTLPADKKRFAPIVYVLLLFIPSSSLHSAGWGATTLNYFWPLAAIMPSAVIIKKILSSEHFSKFFSVISIVLAVFATNQEQLAALVFGLTLVFLCYRIAINRRFKKEDSYFIILLLIALAQLIYMLTCPGNQTRYIQEIKSWFPEYSTLHFVDKLQLGILTIQSYYFSEFFNILIFPLCIVLTIIHHKKNHKFFVSQLIADGIIILIRFCRLIPKGHLLFDNIKLAEFSEYSAFAVGFECVVFIVLGIFLLLSIYKASGTAMESLLNVLLVFSGYCSAFILAFSPTVYASGSRCYLFLTIMILIVTMRLTQSILNGKCAE